MLSVNSLALIQLDPDWLYVGSVAIVQQQVLVLFSILSNTIKEIEIKMFTYDS